MLIDKVGIHQPFGGDGGVILTYHLAAEVVALHHQAKHHYSLFPSYLEKQIQINQKKRKLDNKD